MASKEHSPGQTAQGLDTLSIANLHLENGILAPYVFGDRKQQPATVSISLDLNQGFSSAASTDALDQNTVHYGNLAKAVRDERPEGQTLRDVVDWVEGAVDRMARRRDGTSRVRRCVVCVRLEKASAMGKGVEVISESGSGGVREGRRVRVKFEGVSIMVLIGVNSIERTARQLLEVDLEVLCEGDEALREDLKVFGLEKEMVKIIEPTKFETLESLGEHVVKHLRPKIREALPSCYRMSLTMRKPKAIAFADTPVLSLTRTLPQVRGKTTEEDEKRLRLIKPYV